MMKTKKYIALPVLAALAITVTAASAFAAESQNDQRGEHVGPQPPENFEEIQAAIEDGDYDAWFELVSENEDEHAQKILEVINEDNFDEFVDAHELLEQSRELREQAEEILSDLGIERPERGPGKGFGPGPRGGSGTEEAPQQ